MTATYRGHTFQQVASVIDHSVLKPDATKQDIIDGCEVARRYQTATLCIRPCDVSLAAEMLRGSGVGVATVIGFPHGTTTTATKVFESVEAIDNGANELDMVLNVSALVSGDFDFVRRDIEAVVKAAKARLAVLQYQSDFRNGAFDFCPDRKGLRTHRTGRRGLCENLDWICIGRRHPRERAPYEGHGRGQC